jgi:hypothetical protein
MKTYSYSFYARELGDRLFRQVVEALKNGYKKIDWADYLGGGEYKYMTPEEWTSDFFSAAEYWYFTAKSKPLDLYRAAKRYGRKLRQYKARHKTN